MGNLLSSGSGSGVRVRFPDGSVRELHGPTSVAELMLEHPQQFVVDVRSLSDSKSKAAAALPLPADHVLEPGGAYAMLPMARGKAAGLPADEARRALLGKARRSSLLLRTLGRKTENEMSEEEEEEEAKIGRQETTALSEIVEERPELLTRQYSSRRWKPSLVTIEEKCPGRKLPHWLF